MKKNAAVSKQKVAAKKAPKPYLTKRILISAAKRGFHEAAEAAMQLMGYTIIAKGDWLVKKYADGRIERISRLDMEHNHDEIRLD